VVGTEARIEVSVCGIEVVGYDLGRRDGVGGPILVARDLEQGRVRREKR
jgi:hypothetical protein